MGPCSLHDLEAEDLHELRERGDHLAASQCGKGQFQLVTVHRCRFLEQAACASVCVNVCKMPTQVSATSITNPNRATLLSDVIYPQVEPHM